MQTKPYFMSNDEWYYFDEKEWCYKLTDKAPEDAIESYNEFYADKEIINGVEVIIDK